MYGVTEEDDTKATPRRCADDEYQEEVEDVDDARGEGEEAEVLDDEGGFDEGGGEVVEQGLSEEELRRSSVYNSNVRSSIL